VTSDELNDFATRYAKAWCTQNPESVAASFAENVSLTVNGGPPTPPLKVARRFIRSAAAAVLLMAGIDAGFSQGSANPDIDAIFADLSNPGSPGCALGVYRGGKIIYSKGYGLANVEQNVPITPQTIFDVASISKQFTAASILLLEHQGKLRLDDDVRKYIPELPDYGRKITIQHMLNHTSGLRDYPTLFLLAGLNPDNVTTDDDALTIIARQKALDFPPGSEWLYSGSGYFLLSLIVKRASGKTLKEFATENIFQPLGMTHTLYRDDHTSLIPNRALAYEAAENGSYKLSVSYGEETGDGMVHTSIEDLQKWDENFYSAQVGGKRLLTEMEEQVKLDDGRTSEHAKTFYIQNYRGLRTLWYSGGSAGYRAYLLRFPDQHFSVACLCNLASVNRAKRTHAVSDLYLGGLMQRKENSSVTNLTAQQLQRLTGTYREATTREIWRVSLQAGKLWIDFEGRPAELRALTPTEFEVANSPWETHLTFVPSQNGEGRELIVKDQFRLAGTAEAVEESKPDARELAAFAGDYWSDELRVTYRLAVKKDKLWLKDLIGADGFVHRGNVPSNELRPVLKDEFDLKGARITIHFTRDEKNEVTGFRLDGFGTRGMIFVRRKSAR
jgi:CubicO group peptidase (beta-lactamase class C family)